MNMCYVRWFEIRVKHLVERMKIKLSLSLLIFVYLKRLLLVAVSALCFFLLFLFHFNLLITCLSPFQTVNVDSINCKENLTRSESTSAL